MGKEGDQPISELPASTFTPLPEKLLKLTLDPPSRPGFVGNLGRYEILKLIGHGGMRLVLLARDAETGALRNRWSKSQDARGSRRDVRDGLVAIKMIRPELASEPRVVRRFIKEARHRERLSHPNILDVLDIAEGPPCPYFVMPYVERGSLATLIQRGRMLDRERALVIARQIASAVAHAHSKGIIHRDLKPSNVLVDLETRAYLSDFGLARTLFNDSFIDVRLHDCEGTAPYLSPALASGEAEDTRCDIYAFGALLYEMLTGHPPFEAETTQANLRLIRAGPPRPIPELNPEAPRELVAVADTAMARELRDRYARMSDMAKDLECIANREKPSIASGLSNGRAKQLQSKAPLKAVLAGMAAVLILGAIPVANRLYRGGSTDVQRFREVRDIALPGVWQWSQAE